MKGSLRMRRVLERAVARRGAGRPGRAAAALPGRSCCGWTAGRAGRRSGTGRWPGAPAATRCAGPASTGCSPRCGRRPAGCGVGRLPEQRAFEDEIAERPEFREFLQGLVAPAAPAARARLAGPTGAAAPRTPAGSSPARRSGCSAPAYRSLDDDGADHRRRRAAGRAGRAARQAGAAGRRRKRDPFQLAGGRPRAEHVRRPAAGRPGRGPGAAGGLPGVRARGGRRGAGRLADAVAHDRPARPAGLLDGRRRPGADRLDRRPGRADPGPGPGAGPAPAAPVHADHQLPQLGGDLRGGRGGDPRGSTRTCRCPRAVRSTGVDPVQLVGAGRASCRPPTRRGGRARCWPRWRARSG